MEYVNLLGMLDGRKQYGRRLSDRTPVREMLGEKMLVRGMPDGRTAVDTVLDQLSLPDDGMPVKSTVVSIWRTMEDCLDGSHPCKLTYSHRALGISNYHGNAVTYLCWYFMPRDFACGWRDSLRY